jgi:hypothetical protein
MFTLDGIVPWGRSFDEYRRMFALSAGDLRSSILGCADGPASFNAEATRQGQRVVSCDPLYRVDAEAIRARIAAIFDEMVAQTRQNAGEFVWDEAIPSVDALAHVRASAMERFLDDYESGRGAGRYVDAELPRLPFADGQFDLAVCSHFLFLYAKQLTVEFHVAAARELSRVAGDVRIFPLVALGGAPSAHVNPVMEALRKDGFDVSIEVVPYEFQRGANRMMRIIRRERPAHLSRSDGARPR